MFESFRFCLIVFVLFTVRFAAVSFQRQSIMELCSARCTSNQPGILVIITNLVSGAAAFSTTSYDEVTKTLHVKRTMLTLGQIFPFITEFLSSFAKPNPIFVPTLDSDNIVEQSVVKFKRAKLSGVEGSIAWEHLEEELLDNNSDGRTRVLLTKDFFRSYLSEDELPNILKYPTIYS